ncbi:MAG: Dolichol-p-glucose synthetase, (Glycosyltransferase) [uncultured bacterium (gcode 4)]|uniref:Dolichol-p-glucose synthetase, (Glycosyltransferase) n=1 Tax=uncultured bacterium (gcode 4) TaxID=1234023 RepID=K2BVF3_9BACT|nr:MAG: Dolichol-p-glucose synthetase, (Glycosyltransferase) [uncultured bacterium (gcode 4)]
MTNKKISVIIPALNEWKVIRYAVSRVFEAFKKYNLKGECIIMNSSTDWGITKAEAEKLWARVISIPKQWLWKAYIDSIEHITWDYIIMWDADGTYDFMEMDRFIIKLDDWYDFVMWTRLKWNIHKWAMPWKNRYIWTPFLTFFINFFFKAWISDCNSWLRALTLEAFKKIKLESWGWEYASEMVVKAKLCNLKLTEVPVSLLADRDWRKPHLPAYTAGWNNLKYIFLLASEFIFIKLWFLVSLLWLIILISQIFWPVIINGITFWTYYLFLAILFWSVGFSIFQMWVLTQNFSYLNEFRTTKISKFIKEKFTFERWIVFWLLFWFIWFIFDLVVLIKWFNTWIIDILSVKIWLYALFFIITWVQLIYFSFIFYLFNKNK